MNSVLFDAPGPKAQRRTLIASLVATVLIVLLSVVLQRLRVKPPRQAVSHWHFFPWLYPDTRAPPRQSAFSL